MGIIYSTQGNEITIPTPSTESNDSGDSTDLCVKDEVKVVSSDELKERPRRKVPQSVKDMLKREIRDMTLHNKEIDSRTDKLRMKLMEEYIMVLSQNVRQLEQENTMLTNSLEKYRKLYYMNAPKEVSEE